MPDLSGRRALITGAGGDIGGAAARRLAECGASLVLADLESSHASLESTAMACAGIGRGDVLTTWFDTTDTDGVDQAIGDLAVPPDLLVNNAGYQGGFANVLDASIDDAAHVFAVNALGALAVLRSFARRLAAEGRSGAAVTTASMAGVSGAANMAAYSMSKAAVIAMSKSAAKDLAPHGIRVNAVSPAFIGPGAMWTNQVERQAAVPSQYYADTPDEVARQMIGQVPLRRYGTLGEVADAIAFLLSDEASYITGVNIEVAGGIG